MYFVLLYRYGTEALYMILIYKLLNSKLFLIKYFPFLKYVVQLQSSIFTYIYFNNENPDIIERGISCHRP
jgi:hypothetical protein